MKKQYFIAILIIDVLLYGCSTQTVVSEPVPTMVAVEPVNLVPQEPVRVQAVGYGAESNYADYNTGQRRLMAIRAAKLDAYRSLGEQVYGVYVSAHSRTSAAIIQVDTIRTYIDAFVRGARVIGIVPMVNNTYEVTLEAMLDQSFFACLNTTSRVGCPRSAPPPYQPAFVSHGAFLY